MSKLRANTSFRRLLLGGLVTNAGDSLYFIAAMWLVHDLTGSTLYTGIAGFLVQAPSALGFLVGPLVDRWRLRRVLAGMQLVQGASVLLVPLAAFVDLLSVWVVLAIMPVLSFLNQFVYSAQSAALPQIVPDDQLVRANSMLSTTLQGLDMFFNGASGVLIAIFGAVSLYLVDSVTFFVAFVLFLGVSVSGAGEPAREESDAGEPARGEREEVAMANGDSGAVDGQGDADAASAVEADASADAGLDDEDTSADAEDTSADEEDYFERLRSGLSYVWGSVLAPMLLGLMVVNFVFGTGLAVFPAFATARGGPEAFGFFMAAFAAGNVVGALSANLADDLPFGLFNGASKILAGVLLAGAVVTTSLVASLVLLFAGFVLLGMGVVMSSSLRQSAVADDLLGRVSSVAQSISTAMLPLGSLVGGVVAVVVGVDAILLGVAASISLYGVYFFVHPDLRSLPAVSEADESSLGI